MHITKIEEFSFDHGQHFNTATGEYHSLNPHTLGRPLTHTEMDYNLIYQKQTLNGWRICGSNNDLTLAISDLNTRLEFTQISNSDDDWSRFQAAGLFNGQFVWTPVAGSTGTPNATTSTTTTTAAPTTTTSTTTAAPTTTTSTTTTTAAPAVYSSLTATPSPADEGQNIIINLSGTNIPNGRTVGWTITGVDTGDISGSLTGTFTMNSNQAEYIITVTEDLITEGTETLTLTCAANDNAGTTCGLSVAIDINDTSLTPTTTTSTTTSTTSTTTTTAAPTTTTSTTSTTTTTEAPTYTVETLFNHSAATTYHEMQTPLGTDVGNSHTINNSGLAAGSTMSHTVYLVADAGWEFDYSGLQVLLGGSPINLNNQPAGVTITQQSATQIRIQRDYVNIQANATSTMNISAVPMDQIFDCNYAGLSITIPAGSVGAAVTGTVTVDGQAASNVSFSPAQYQLGNQTYNVTFDIPAGFANSGQITCQSSASGTTTSTTTSTTTTTEAPTTTTTSTTTTAAPTLTGYYFHGGQNNYPANADLTAGTGPYFYNPGGGFTQTNDFDQAMSYVMDNMGTMGNGFGSEYDIISFNIPGGGIPALGNSDQLVFPTNDTAELYYIILPDGQVDLTDSTAMHLYNTNFGANTNAVAKRSFTWNGNLYWIYKTGFQGDTISRTLGFSDID